MGRTTRKGTFMRTSSTTSGSPGSHDSGPVDPTKSSDKINGLDPGAGSVPPTPQSMASNTLMDGAANQVSQPPQPPQTDTQLIGPDDEGEEEE